MFAQAVHASFQVLLFRAGPQDFPYSRPLTQAVVSLAVLANYFQFRFTLPPLPAMAQAIASIVILCAYALLLLQLKQLGARAQQTCNTLLATNIVLTLLLMPALIALQPILPELASNPDLMKSGRVPLLPFFGMFVISVWSLAVTTHIFRQALEVRMLPGVLAALGSAFVIYVVAGSVGALFAGAAAAG